MDSRICLATIVASTLAFSSPSIAAEFASETAYLNQRAQATETMSGAQALGLMRAVELVVSDQVNGSCWTNQSEVFHALRSELVMAGVTVYTEPLASYDALSPILRLSTIGYQAAGGACIGHMTLETIIRSNSELGSLTHTQKVFNIAAEARLWSVSTIFSGKNLNATIVETARRWADRLANDIRIARNDPSVQRFNAVWPKAAPRTRAETGK